MRLRTVVLALAAGLALADASVVTLALPQLLVELSTSVEGVAAVIGVYALVLALSLLPAWSLTRRFSAPEVGAAGFAVFALASLGCALANDLTPLLIARALQALGGAAGLVATFELLAGGTSPRNLWLGAAILSTAVGPALGGALTQAFSWQAIFLAQVPFAAAAAAACLGSESRAVAAGKLSAPLRPALALGLLSAALSAVLFLLVLLLVAGWAKEPLSAALAVTVLPLAALAGSRVGGEADVRAAAGCVLVGAGTIALAYLPDASAWWTVAPQVLAGLGMGMALPALAGELLPERTAYDAAVLLTIRHAAIVLALVVLAPITATRLEDATQKARERGIALVLDAKLKPERKLDLAPELLSGVDDDRPRAGLAAAFTRVEADLDGSERTVVDGLAERTDETLVTAVGESFFVAFLITGLLALAGAAVVVPGARRPAWVAAAVGVGALVVAGQVIAHKDREPEPVTLQDPCHPNRDLPDTGGITGFLQDRALELLDRRACDLGSSREELVLALADEDDARRFEERHGADPRSATGLIGSLLGG